MNGGAPPELFVEVLSLAVLELGMMDLRLALAFLIMDF